MSTVATSNISFSGLKANYVAGDGGDADGDSNLADKKKGTTNPPASAISLSFFRGAGLDGGEPSVPSSGEISINDDLKGKTFGGDDY